MDNKIELKPIPEGKKELRDHRYFKNIILTSVGILVLVVISNLFLFTGGFKTFLFHQWAEEQYFGVITEIRDNGFNIADRGSNVRNIILNNETKIFQGRQIVAIDFLKLSDYVLVVGSINSKNQIEARIIRIFPPNKSRQW